VKIGMMNNPRFDLLAEIAWAQKNGFDFLDLTLEPAAAYRGQIELAEIHKALQDSNLEIIGHTAYYLPLASPFESLRKAALEEMRWAVEVFAQLRASKMTVHPDKSIASAIGSKGVLQKNLQSFAEIEVVARPLGIQVLIENMDRTFNTVEQIRQALSQIPQLGFHLDVGHANLNAEQNRTGEFLRAFHDRLAHVHLSDNFGQREDLHLPLGAGTIDWKKIIPMLKDFGYDGTITLEIFSIDRRYLLFSRDKLLEIWES
jgi:sugar phosphate isomerase/epimerase